MVRTISLTGMRHDLLAPLADVQFLVERALVEDLTRPEPTHPADSDLTSPT